MSQLDNYRAALLGALPDTPAAVLDDVLVSHGPQFASFVVDHGLGPLWHERTKNSAFQASRLSAEALYLAQEQALHEIDATLEEANIEFAVIKGAANRLLLYENPALRACHDLDLLVRPDDRVRAAAALLECGFAARLQPKDISRELVLSRRGVDIDLHWGLLREGRLRSDGTEAMLQRRRRSHNVWMLSAEDAFFVLLVHPAFAKHLAGWDMGLHRVADILAWLRSQPLDWTAVCNRLADDGVRTAAWATLHWLELLLNDPADPAVAAMIAELRPGRLRGAWLDYWLRHDLSARSAGKHWLRLMLFSPFLHDSPRDPLRALAGRYRARRRCSADLKAFSELPG
jgi:hypothetical protein